MKEVQYFWKNKENFVPSICEKCIFLHVENCPDCFGFGIRRVNGETVPISAKYINGESKLDNWERCDTCGGTPFGMG